MADPTASRNRCTICEKIGICCRCLGCHGNFCFDCLLKHRSEIATEFNRVIRKKDQLCRVYNESKAIYRHPLFSRISAWEEDSITKIKQAAKEAQEKLQEALYKVKLETTTQMNKLNVSLNTANENADYTEEDITYWYEQLGQIKEKFKRPLGSDLVDDETRSPIYLIKLEVMTGNVASRPRMTSSKSTESSEDLLDKQTSSQKDSDYEDLLEQIENINVILLQISTSNGSELSEGLEKLTEGHYCSMDQNNPWLSELQSQSRSTLIINMSGLTPTEQDQNLTNIFEQTNICSIYIQGTPPESNDARHQFFFKYPIIKAMFENEQSLLAQWAMDTANQYKRIGDAYIKKGERDLAQQYFTKGVALYKRLSTYLYEKKT